MRIAVAGGTGALGRHIVEELASQGRHGALTDLRALARTRLSLMGRHALMLPVPLAGATAVPGEGT